MLLIEFPPSCCRCSGISETDSCSTMPFSHPQCAMPIAQAKTFVSPRNLTSLLCTFVHVANTADGVGYFTGLVEIGQVGFFVYTSGMSSPHRFAEPGRAIYVRGTQSDPRSTRMQLVIRRIKTVW
jgi:hypothetical protein